MPKLSVVLSTNRPEKWAAFCANLTKNRLDLEAIFVGPSAAPRGWRSPVPLRFIHSNAKPAACWEIGARAAAGDFVSLGTDDMHCSPGFYDDAVDLARATPNIYDTYAGRFVDDKGDQTHGVMLLGFKSMPFMPVGGIAFTEAHHKSGGIDRQFHATLWDCDLYQRFLVEGGRCTLLPGHCSREYSTGSTLFVRYSEHDKIFLKALWFKDGRPTLTRSLPVQPFTTKDLA